MLPTGTILGELEILEIYQYFDGPRIFAAQNSIGTMYLVYWCDETQESSGWLYLPISETRLSDLRRKLISLREAFLKPETSCVLAYTYPLGQDNAYIVMSGEIGSFLPPPERYIQHVSVVSKHYQWSFETYLKGKKPIAEVTSHFIGRFQDLAESIMRSLSESAGHLQVESALAGSLRIKFGADNQSTALQSLQVIQSLLISASEEELRAKLLQHQIDPSQLRDFLNAISSNRLDVEIIPKLASYGDVITFPIDQIRRCVAFLNRISLVIVESIKIPQADNLDKVIMLVQLVHGGVPLSPDTLGGLNSYRQIAYYRDAAYALGLITRDLQLTSAGEFVTAQPSTERQYQILADRFDGTDFGWAWLRWAGVQNMTELAPATAEAFLSTAVPELSPITAERRAQTLRTWLIKLQPYHRKYVQKEESV